MGKNTKVAYSVNGQGQNHQNLITFHSFIQSVHKVPSQRKKRKMKRKKNTQQSTV